MQGAGREGILEENTGNPASQNWKEKYPFGYTSYFLFLKSENNSNFYIRYKNFKRLYIHKLWF